MTIPFEKLYKRVTEIYRKKKKIIRYKVSFFLISSRNYSSLDHVTPKLREFFCDTYDTLRLLGYYRRNSSPAANSRIHLALRLRTSHRSFVIIIDVIVHALFYGKNSSKQRQFLHARIVEYICIGVPALRVTEQSL